MYRRLTVDISVVKNEVLYYKEEEEERNMKDETDDDGREEGRKKCKRFPLLCSYTNIYIKKKD